MNTSRSVTGTISDPRPWSGPVLASAILLAAMVAGCGVDGIQVAESYEPLVTSVVPVNTGSTAPRYKYTADGEYCAYECEQWAEEDTGGERLCLRWELECRPYRHVMLGADAAAFSDLANPRPFPAYRAPADPDYIGCGAEAAQTVLAYAAVRDNLVQVGAWIRTIDVPFSDLVATTPAALQSGMELLLNSSSPFDYRVTRHSGKDHAFIKAELERGFPVVVLSDGGTHWLTVTGYDGKNHEGDVDRFFVTDYGNVGHWRTPSQLSLDISGGNAWLSAISLGFEGYLPGAVLTIEASPPPPPPACQCDRYGLTRTCSLNRTQTCDGCRWGPCIPAGGSPP